jgi:hypothetical protein
MEEVMLSRSNGEVFYVDRDFHGGGRYNFYNSTYSNSRLSRLQTVLGGPVCVPQLDAGVLPHLAAKQSCVWPVLPRIDVAHVHGDVARSRV